MLNKKYLLTKEDRAAYSAELNDAQSAFLQNNIFHAAQSLFLNQDFADGHQWRLIALNHDPAQQLRCECGRKLKNQYVIEDAATHETHKLGSTHFAMHMGIPDKLASQVARHVHRFNVGLDEILYKHHHNDFPDDGFARYIQRRATRRSEQIQAFLDLGLPPYDSWLAEFQDDYNAEIYAAKAEKERAERVKRQAKQQREWAEQEKQLMKERRVYAQQIKQEETRFEAEKRQKEQKLDKTIKARQLTHKQWLTVRYMPYQQWSRKYGRKLIEPFATGLTKRPINDPHPIFISPIECGLIALYLHDHTQGDLITVTDTATWLAEIVGENETAQAAASQRLSQILGRVFQRLTTRKLLTTAGEKDAFFLISEAFADLPDFKV